MILFGGLAKDFSEAVSLGVGYPLSAFLNVYERLLLQFRSGNDASYYIVHLEWCTHRLFSLFGMAVNSVLCHAF